MRLFKSSPRLTDLPQIAIQADAIRILNSATQFRQSLLEQIAQAKHRIYLCSLYLQHDEAGQVALDALYAAQRLNPALQIHVLVDWHRAQRGLIGEQKIPGKVAGNAAWYQNQSAAHGGVIPIYGVPVQTRELFGVFHLKGFVIDDTVIYSGASINNVYLQQFDKYRHDRYWLIQDAGLANSMVDWVRRHVLSSAAVHRLDIADIPRTKDLRAEMRGLREHLKNVAYQLPGNQCIEDAQSLCVTSISGLGKNNLLNRSLCQLLAVAKKQITICTPYFNFPRPIMLEVNRALKRGVKVSIIVGDKTANDFYIPPQQAYKAIGSLPYLYEVNLRRFVKTHQAEISSAALQVHLWKDGDNTYHLKGVWIDELYTLVTGNNLNPRAFSLDLENALLFTDPSGELSVQRQAELDSIMQHTTTLQHYRDLESLKDYPDKVRQLLQRLSRVRLDHLAYRVL
nr:CDP-diacylglycerol--serine O-phosphatidyltransferase [uncultured Undibacterium sp.]